MKPGHGIERFRQAALDAQGGRGPTGGALSVHDTADYEDMRLFLTADGGAGFALNGDELVTLFNTAGGHKGLNATALQLAIQQGARRLDVFDTIVAGMYSDNGFRVVARTPWDDAQAPKGLKAALSKKGYDEPDLVFMVFDPDHGKLYKPGASKSVGAASSAKVEGQMFDDYSDAWQHAKDFEAKLKAGRPKGKGLLSVPGAPVVMTPEQQQSYRRGDLT